MSAEQHLSHGDAAQLGWRVLVETVGSTKARWARVGAIDTDRPHLLRVAYENTPGAAVWVRRARVRAAYVPRPARLPAQLDLDGQAHDIAPETRQEHLFTPAPAAMRGQTHLDTDGAD